MYCDASCNDLGIVVMHATENVSKNAHVISFPRRYQELIEYVYCIEGGPSEDDELFVLMSTSNYMPMASVED